MSKLISVIIPVYNASQFIIANLNSVLSQTYKNLEVILIDDFSKDNSVKIIKKFINSKKKKINIRLISLSSNSGLPSVTRNIGIKAAKGEYIAFLDPDDIWHPKKLEYQLSALESSSSYLCSSYAKDFKINEYKKYVKKNLSNNNFIFINLFDQMIKYRTPTSSWLISAKVAKKNLFDENVFYKGKEDLKYSIFLHSKYGKSIKCNNTLVFYRNHKNQISKKKILMLLKTMYILIFTKLFKSNYLKIFFPAYLFSNIFYYLYYRKIFRIL
jgi:teichuronic acid biosynthesis glycosyltransferase TuaG